jgi:hypothetical protein
MSPATTPATTSPTSATTGPASPPSPTFQDLAAGFDRASRACDALAAASGPFASPRLPEAEIERDRLGAEVARLMHERGAKFVRLAPDRLLIEESLHHAASRVFVAVGPAAYRNELVVPPSDWRVRIVDLADANDL